MPRNAITPLHRGLALFAFASNVPMILLWLVVPVSSVTVLAAIAALPSGLIALEHNPTAYRLAALSLASLYGVMSALAFADGGVYLLPAAVILLVTAFLPALAGDPRSQRRRRRLCAAVALATLSSLIVLLIVQAV